MSIKKDFVLPIIVLFVICLVVSGALAIVNNVTKPVIEKAAAERATDARKEIIPQADGFEIFDIEMLRSDNNMPRAVTEVLKATNDTGYIFTVTEIGYGGEVNFICGISPNGRIIRAKVLSHNETPSFAARVFNESHLGQYWDTDRNGIEEIAAISGATLSSGAFKNAMRHALTAFEIVSRTTSVQEEASE